MKLTLEKAAAIDRNEISVKELTEEQEIYKENIIDHYKNPHNKHEIKNCTFCRHELNPLCGDEITMFAKIKNNKIEKLSFTGSGCAISQASASMITDYAAGMKLEDATKLVKEDVLKLLGIPISIVRMKCALLPLKTLLNGINGYRGNKNGQA